MLACCGQAFRRISTEATCRIPRIGSFKLKYDWLAAKKRGAYMQLKAAIVGLGFVGRAHLEALWRIGISVRGVLGSTPERSKAASESLRLPRSYNSLEELAADDSVQVVHLCTPNHLHFQEASQLLRAGKHVLCEKPLALDSRESAALVSLLRKQDW